MPEQADILRRRVARERRARKEAEALLESKSLELFAMNKELVAALEIEAQKDAAEALNAELKKANASLELARAEATQSSRAKSEFLANMSHEIRTPMTAILGFAENLLDEDRPESEKRSFVQIIQRNGEHLLGLINDILDLSKIEAGKMMVENICTNLCEIIVQVALLMKVPADAKGLQFNVEYIGAIPATIQCDPTRLRQILINMVSNAIKFTEVGSVRLITSFVDQGDTSYIQFDVTDTGNGMAQNQVENLFQPFVQADSSTTRKFGGTGLGLTISKRFAKMLGGDISMPSTELGVGTTFRATVATGTLRGVNWLSDPAAATVVSDAAGEQANVKTTSLRGRRILLAEDTRTNQVLISGILKKAGAEVTVEENGKLAMDVAMASLAHGDPFDIVLMDMQMPVMDGYEATRKLRRNGYTGSIIALTAHAMSNDRRKCLDAGCDEFATKPIARLKLIKTIQMLLPHAEATSATSI